MFHRIVRFAAAIFLPLVLTGCLLAPGKFTAKLTINADRSFAYSYIGEVIAIDPIGDLPKSNADGDHDPDFDPSQYDDGVPTFQRIARHLGFADEPGADAKAERDRRLTAIAEALRKEQGYRRVDYLGDGKFSVDYAASGTLSHNFVYPFNLDATAIIPFVAVELRANGTARVRAPAFGEESAFNPAARAGLGNGGGPPAENKAEGTFTLDTDAEIVSQNNEDGVTTAGTRKLVSWQVTPLTKAAPMAVVKFRP